MCLVTLCVHGLCPCAVPTRRPPAPRPLGTGRRAEGLAGRTDRTSAWISRLARHKVHFPSPPAARCTLFPPSSFPFPHAPHLTLLSLSLSISSSLPYLPSSLTRPPTRPPTHHLPAHPPNPIPGRVGGFHCHAVGQPDRQDDIRVSHCYRILNALT